MTNPSTESRSPTAVIRKLLELASQGTVVVAHRGASRDYPENTLPAFQAAVGLGVTMQEFDVQETACGALVCLHDTNPDRTTDSCQRLGPGSLVAQSSLATLRQLDAGSWKAEVFRNTRVPTLDEALAVMLPTSIPMIEHKGGSAERFVDDLRAQNATDQVLLQSFDWEFVATAKRLAPELAVGMLGPVGEHAHVDDAVVKHARSIGAELVHWHAAALRAEDVDLLHDSGLLVCTYTSDDALTWFGAQHLGLDAMCTNDPAGMLAALGRTVDDASI